jgi:hypothetical protein
MQSSQQAESEMTCLVSERIVVCRQTVDVWSRFFARCPVCGVRRLCLEEFQDWYGSRCTCLTCGAGWMEGECRKASKREQAKVIADAKARIKKYIAVGFAQGYARFFARLEHERVLRMIRSGRLLGVGASAGEVKT